MAAGDEDAAPAMPRWRFSGAVRWSPATATASLRPLPPTTTTMNRPSPPPSCPSPISGHSSHQSPIPSAAAAAVPALVGFISFSSRHRPPRALLVELTQIYVHLQADERTILAQMRCTFGLNMLRLWNKFVHTFGPYSQKFGLTLLAQ